MGTGIWKAISIAAYDGSEILELLYFLKVFSNSADGSMGLGATFHMLGFLDVQLKSKFAELFIPFLCLFLEDFTLLIYQEDAIDIEK